MFSNQYIVSQNRNVGLDGTADSNPRIWAGASYQGRNNAPFRIYDDGSIYSVKGYIGGFAVSDTMLYASDKALCLGQGDTGLCLWKPQRAHA